MCYTDGQKNKYSVFEVNGTRGYGLEQKHQPNNSGCNNPHFNSQNSKQLTLNPPL
jgi:hypothetical protein